MSTVLMRNNEPCVHSLALPHKQNTTPTAPQTILVKPGINEIDADHWARVKDDLIVRYYLTNASPSTVGRPVFEVVERREGLALALIAETFDRELLRKWLESENDPSVISAIQAQLARIVPQPANTQPAVTAMAPEQAREQTKRSQK